MTTGRINQVCTQPPISGQPKPTRVGSFARNGSTNHPISAWRQAPELQSIRAYTTTLPRKTRRDARGDPTPQAHRSCTRWRALPLRFNPTGYWHSLKPTSESPRKRPPVSQPAPKTIKTPCALIAMGLGCMSTSWRED